MVSTCGYAEFAPAGQGRGWPARFGWTSSDRWFRDSRGHGYCSTPRDNWFLRAIFHPNVAGYEGKAKGLLAEAQRLGLKVP